MLIRGVNEISNLVPSTTRPPLRIPPNCPNLLVFLPFRKAPPHPQKCPWPLIWPLNNPDKQRYWGSAWILSSHVGPYQSTFCLRGRDSFLGGGTGRCCP